MTDNSDQPVLTPEEELTATYHRRIDRFVRPVALLILVYYGGSQYGSHYISHPLWQGIILWPILAAAFTVVILDDATTKKHPVPRFSRWLTRRLIERRGTASRLRESLRRHRGWPA